MATTFSRSMRSLEADGFRRSTLGLAWVGLMLAAGLGWFFFARITLYETAEGARLEVQHAAHPVEVPHAGRVVASFLTLGQQVQAGDLLVELDSESERLELEQEKARLATTSARLEAVREQITAEQQAWPVQQKAALMAIEEARARVREAEAAAQFAEGDAERFRSLDKSGIAAKADRLRAEAEADKLRAAASAQASTVTRLEAEEKSKGSDHEIRLAKLQRDLALVGGDIGTAKATVKSYEHELELHRIQAPVAGRLGEIAELRAGGYVAAGQRLAVVVPAGELRAVAQFAPGTALGRIRPGQPARLRLDGFPWPQYGSIPAKVQSVANEPNAGRLRVEFALQPDRVSLIPAQHGLSGSVEVQVERLSPARLVWRLIGKLLTTPAPPSGNPKAEIRRPKEGRNPNAEIRMAQAGRLAASAFGLRTSDFLRPSDFAPSPGRHVS